VRVESLDVLRLVLDARPRGSAGILLHEQPVRDQLQAAESKGNRPGNPSGNK